MKNGRFSEKKIGNRWLTSTWKASLSTWLKSGLTVASSVIVDESPHFALMPKSPSASALPPLARRDPLLVAREHGGRNQLARRPRLEIREAELGMLLEHPRAWLERRPRHRHAGAADAPPEEDAHLHVGAATEADRLQRQTNLDRVALVVDTACAVPDPVRRGVFVPRQRVDHVELNAAGIDHQMVGRLPGAERVQAQADPVVAPDVVAAGDRRLDAARLGVVAAEGKIERVLVVANPDRGLLRHGIAVQRVVRLPLSRLQRRRRPRIIVQAAVDDRRLAEKRGAQAGRKRHLLRCAHRRVCRQRQRERCEGQGSRQAHWTA